MPETLDALLLAALLNAWDRNNTILLGLLGALPTGGLDARATGSSPTVSQLFAHLCFTRICTVYENDPEIARVRPDLLLHDDQEWAAEHDPEVTSQRLKHSSGVIRDAFRGWVEAGRGRIGVYEHPVLLLQHVLWHEAYHTGQIKLALRAAGLPMSDEVAGPITWDVWRREC